MQAARVKRSHVHRPEQQPVPSWLHRHVTPRSRPPRPPPTFEARALSTAAERGRLALLDVGQVQQHGGHPVPALGGELLPGRGRSSPRRCARRIFAPIRFKISSSPCTRGQRDDGEPLLHLGTTSRSPHRNACSPFGWGPIGLPVTESMTVDRGRGAARSEDGSHLVRHEVVQVEGARVPGDRFDPVAELRELGGFAGGFVAARGRVSRSGPRHLRASRSGAPPWPTRRAGAARDHREERERGEAREEARLRRGASRDPIATRHDARTRARFTLRSSRSTLEDPRIRRNEADSLFRVSAYLYCIVAPRAHFGGHLLTSSPRTSTPRRPQETATSPNPSLLHASRVGRRVINPNQRSAHVKPHLVPLLPRRTASARAASETRDPASRRCSPRTRRPCSPPRRRASTSRHSNRRGTRRARRIASTRREAPLGDG